MSDNVIWLLSLEDTKKALKQSCYTLPNGMTTVELPIQVAASAKIWIERLSKGDIALAKEDGQQ